MTFFAFTYNNMEKSLEVYLNSEKIFKKTVKMHLDSFVIDQNFLQNEKFGKGKKRKGGSGKRENPESTNPGQK